MERELLIARMIREVSEQGKKNIAQAEELTKTLTDIYLGNNYQDITIVACGSSYNGANCGRTFMEKILKRKVRVLSPENFEFYDNLIEDDELVCVVSFSGASTNSISALQKIKDSGRQAIGITGYLESDFRYIADVTIEYGLNGEEEPYETKGVTLLALYFMLFALEAGLRRKTITKEEYDSYHQEMIRCMDAHDDVMNRTTEFVQKHRIPLIGMPDMPCHWKPSSSSVNCSRSVLTPMNWRNSFTVLPSSCSRDRSSSSWIPVKRPVKGPLRSITPARSLPHLPSF